MSDDETADTAAQARASAAVTAASLPPYTLLHTKNTPIPLKFQWSRQAVYPSRVGVRKDLYPLGGLVRFRAKADVLIPSGQLVYGFSVKDTILGGRFQANIPARVLAYSKTLTLPNGMNVALSLGGQYLGSGDNPLLRLPFKQRFKPICGFQLRFGGGAGEGSNVVYNGDGFSVKQRVPLPLGMLGLRYPRFELETFTSVRVPQLMGRYSVHNDALGLGRPVPTGGGGGTVLGGGGGGGGFVSSLLAPALQDASGDALTVAVNGINAVIRL